MALLQLFMQSRCLAATASYKLFIYSSLLDVNSASVHVTEKLKLESVVKSDRNDLVQCCLCSLKAHTCLCFNLDFILPNAFLT